MLYRETKVDALGYTELKKTGAVVQQKRHLVIRGIEEGGSAARSVNNKKTG